MDQTKLIEIQNAVKQTTEDVVKAQIAKGAPDRGLNKQRHMAIVADVSHEMLASYADVNDDRSVREVLRATYSGSLLNASQLRQELEKAGVLKRETALSGVYGVDL